jgi:sporadic carbohydrate cluster protein (TIGR04323 family)
MKLKGYIFSRPFFEERVPQNVQNIILRDYCKKKNYSLLLSSTEYVLPNSSLILFEIIDNLEKCDGIIFYSLMQLPINKQKRHHLFKKIINKKKQIHFALENIVGNNKKNFEDIEKIFLLKTKYSENKKINNKNTKQNFITKNHKATKRDHIGRMLDDKVKCMKISKKYSFDYWDGDRRYGYGGFKYIPGYNEDVAKKLIETYNLTNESKILDLGCGKGFLLHEISKILPKAQILGLDISKYAKRNTLKEINKRIKIQDLRKRLKFKDNSFDLVISINTLHNFKISEIYNSFSEIERIGKSKFVCVESYRNEQEQFNLQCWALTAETLIDTDSWKWIMKQSGYTGDYEFIYF